MGRVSFLSVLHLQYTCCTVYPRVVKLRIKVRVISCVYGVRSRVGRRVIVPVQWAILPLSVNDMSFIMLSASQMLEQSQQNPCVSLLKTSLNMSHQPSSSGKIVISILFL